MTLAPISAELRDHNRRILAERLGWPIGARRACELIEQDNPGWHAWWQRAEWRRPEGWYATHYGHLEQPTYGAEPHLLHAAIRAHRC